MVAARTLLNAGGVGSEKEDSEPEEGCGSPGLPRRYRARLQQQQNMYIDTLPEV